MEGICVLTNTSNKRIKGFILFNEEKGRTKITINIVGLKKNSKLGFHIHEFGDLREDCANLCLHFNPNKTAHGGKDSKIRHAGDLGNIETNKNGICKKIIYDKVIKLKGKYNILGRSVVIHEKEDDLGLGGNKESLITGNAGKRIACGVIGYSKKC
jgi:Cu-Zn family superoxide dismutase